MNKSYKTEFAGSEFTQLLLYALINEMNICEKM